MASPLFVRRLCRSFAAALLPVADFPAGARVGGAGVATLGVGARPRVAPCAPRRTWAPDSCPGRASRNAVVPWPDFSRRAGNPPGGVRALAPNSATPSAKSVT